MGQLSTESWRPPSIWAGPLQKAGQVAFSDEHREPLPLPAACGGACACDGKVPEQVVDVTRRSLLRGPSCPLTPHSASVQGSRPSLGTCSPGGRILIEP